MSKRYIKKQLLNKQQKFGRRNKEVNPDSYNPLLQRSASLPTLSKRMQLAPRSSKSLTDLTKVNGQDSTLLNAKSEVSLKTITVRNTPAFSQSLRVLRDLANRRMHRNSIDTSISSFGQSSQSNSPKEGVVGLFDAVRVPIVGYEVMEERARFTIFKLRIENKVANTSWLVLRRYTDFMRLYGKLKALFPGHNLPTFPRKKWFGNNFSSTFLDNRISGLQTFINQVIADDELKKAAVVREFFCLDEAPTYSESMEECRAIFEAQEETIGLLKRQLQDRDDALAELMLKLQSEANQIEFLRSVIRNTFGNCSKCSKDLDNHFKGATLTYGNAKTSI